MAESATAEIQEEANALRINVNENSESEREANRALANNITQMLESPEPPLSLKCCIYKVPTVLRKVNEQAYTPRVISIGPFHHGDERLKTMEKLKVTYFKIFVEELNVENLVTTIRNREARVRRCYSHTSGLSSDDYVKMILLDASFIIVFFLKKSCVKEWRRYDSLIAFSQRVMAPVLIDMLLLENQLPFFIIEELYNIAFASHSNYHSTIPSLSLSVDYFQLW
jgi:hypothetical protein